MQRLEPQEMALLALDNDMISQNDSDTEPVDHLSLYKKTAIEKLSANQEFHRKTQGEGITWIRLKYLLIGFLPDTLEDRDNMAYHLVREALEQVLGPENEGWGTFRNEQNKICVKAIRKDGSNGLGG